MSGQDYVYIVWWYFPDGFGARKVAMTFPTKYQAQKWVDSRTQPPCYAIERWRHGDTQGHFIEC